MISENIGKISRKHITRMVGIIVMTLLVMGTALGEDLLIESWSPLTDPTTTIGTEQTFSINLNGQADVIWTIDNSAVWSDFDVMTSSYTGNVAGIGIYNVVATATNGIDIVSQEWIWTVNTTDPDIYCPSPPIITYATGNFWIDYIINPDTTEEAYKTDRIDVSLDNGITWQEDVTPGTDFNISLGPHGQGSILAIAYNNSNSGCTSDTASENVQLDNNIPVLDHMGDKIVIVENELTFTVHAIDLDYTDIITYSKDNPKGDLDSSTGIYSWTPKNGDIGEHTVTISSDDGYEGIDSETIKITVVDNQPDTYMPPTPVNLDCTQGNFWIYCIWQPDEGNNTDSYHIDIDGTPSDTTNNSINIITGPHQQKNISVRAYNNSGGGSLNPIPISKNVQMTNNKPVQDIIGNKVVIVGQILTFTVNATDVDGDVITYNTSATKGLFNSSTKIYSWTPNSNDIGTYTQSFCSNDNYEGSACETMTITVNTNNGGNGGNGGNNGNGNSGGSSSGGGTSGESYYNIEFKKRQELDIHKDVVTSYIFTDKMSPIMFVNITGNSNTGEVIGIMEVLKNRSSLLTVSAPGLIYKNINIWIGTSSFATSKNIKFPTKITFRVDNSWINKNSVTRDNIKMVRWDGKKWITIDTLGKIKDNNYTYFDANTDGFTHFAITELKSGSVSTVTPAKSKTIDVQNSQTLTENQTPNLTENIPEVTSDKPANGFNILGILSVVLVILVIYIIRQKG